MANVQFRACLATLIIPLFCVAIPSRTLHTRRNSRTPFLRDVKLRRVRRRIFDLLRFWRMCRKTTIRSAVQWLYRTVLEPLVPFFGPIVFTVRVLWLLRTRRWRLFRKWRLVNVINFIRKKFIVVFLYFIEGKFWVLESDHFNNFNNLICFWIKYDCFRQFRKNVMFRLDKARSTYIIEIWNKNLLCWNLQVAITRTKTNVT